MRTCLVVDDSRVIRKVARRILEDLGFEIAEAGDGMEALAWCRAAMPDAVLLDWNMPVMVGPSNDRYPETARRYNRLFDLDSIADKIGYPLFMKPFDGDIIAAKFELAGFA